MAAGTNDRDNATLDGGPRARGTLFFGVVFTLLFMAVGARLVQLQVMEFEERTREVAKMVYDTTSVRDHRGMIMDSRGVTLAVSVAAKSLALDPREFLGWYNPEVEKIDNADARKKTALQMSGQQRLVTRLSALLDRPVEEVNAFREKRLLERLEKVFGLEPAELEKISRGLEKRYVPEKSKTGIPEPRRFMWIRRKITEEQYEALQLEFAAARKEAADARQYRKRWRALADKRKAAGDMENAERFLKLAEGWETIALEAGGRFGGVVFPPEFRRVYPQGQLASHIVGFGDIEGHGREGVERICDPLLKGQSIRRVVGRDARSRALSTMADDSRTTMGMNVELTIDSVIQAIVEEELKVTVDDFKKESPNVNAHAVVMDPFTGNILAIANYPTFNPNHPAVDAAGKPIDPRNRRNDAVAAVQEPGSTFKPLMVAASLEEKVAVLSDSIECASFQMNGGRRTIKDMYPYGRMTLEMALVKSSNPAMVRLGQKLGPERMREYVLKFGFGKKTGSRLPGEVNGRVTAADKWTEWTMGSVPMGYEINVTTLQMARAYSTFANGGMLMKPQIVRAVYDEKGGLDFATKPEATRRVISEETAAIMRKVLRKVVTDGTGRRANIDEYELGGKTGTANMLASDEERAAGVRGYSAKKRHTANFVSLAPWDKPKVVICISVRDTNKYGGDGAGPTMGRVARRVLGYLGVPTKNGEPVRADIMPRMEFQTYQVPVIYTVGAEDDDNYLGEEVDPRWMDDWIDDEEALG